MGEARPWDVPPQVIAEEATAGFLERCAKRPDALIYLVLNVGDGDTQLLLLPERQPGEGRRALVVDVATKRKLPPVLEQLDAAGVLAPQGSAHPTFPIVIGTHPHGDHIGGMAEFLELYGDRVGEYWEPGYYHPSAAFVETMVRLEDAPWIGLTQPTSGTTRYIDRIKLTVLTPGVNLRNHFDTYGTEINNSSISLKVEFPAARVTSLPDKDEPQHDNRIYLRLNDPWSIILGGDTQTTGWAQAEVDFPQLHRDHNPALYKELRAAAGRDHLRGDVFKLPHHASKHGLNLELIERVKPRVALVSSVGGGGRYEFPHRLSLDATREALQPTTSSGASRLPDHRLGIHYTAGRTHRSTGETERLGSIALLALPEPRQDLEMWRFGDGPRDKIDLGRSRKVAYVRDLSPEPDVDLTDGPASGGDTVAAATPGGGTGPGGG